jgi:glyoxylase-like metal-dependent hydrolase (beta-lactamase superfamily II)
MSHDDIEVLQLKLPNYYFELDNNVYVILSSPLILVDTGSPTEEAYGALLEGFSRNNLAIERVGTVLLTHKHFDHAGNAWRIQEISNAEIMVHSSDLDGVVGLEQSGERFRNQILAALGHWDVPVELVGSQARFSPSCWSLRPSSPVTLREGTYDRGGVILQVYHTPGHTEGSVCIKCGPHLFTGDHILKTITPNIGAGDLGKTGLLSLYLQSLRMIERLAGCRDMQMHSPLIARPGHGDEFSDIPERCREIIGHHEARLQVVADILRDRPPSSVYEVACGLFGEITEENVFLAAAEAYAHLEFLTDNGIARRMGNKFCL